jgi:hypothetical protein
MSEDLVAMARAAQHDDRLADGALYGKLADQIERYKWHPRSTAPKDGTPCLFVRRDGKMTVDWWDLECTDRFWKEYGGEYLYTHWMPLPSSPELSSKEHS